MPDFYSVAKKATDIFCTFSDTKPLTTDIGIPAIRERIGNFFEGNTVVIGAAQNVGKTSFVQRMLLESHDNGGVASGEDGEDVWGCRILAEASGVPPASIRKDSLTDQERARVRTALDALKGRSEQGLLPHVENAMGCSLDGLTEVAKKLADKGCRYAILDYLQKFRGIHAERRHEVAGTLAHWHKACTDLHMVPVALSQVVRMPHTAEPQSWHLKESGDLENEARMIILLWREQSDELIMRCKVAKSSFGGGGYRFAYRFGDDESLRPWDGEEEEW